MPQQPTARIQDLFGLSGPIILAPMAGAAGVELAVAVARGGGLGSLPCAMLSIDQARQQVAQYRDAVKASVNLNFFCHAPPAADPAKAQRWRDRLAPYYAEHGLDPDAPVAVANRAPFDADWCALVEALKPEVVSFHFGLPDTALLQRVKAAGAKVMSSATTLEEGLWLEAAGCDAVIAMGAEAGGHRGMFLTADVATQPGTFALVRQLSDALRVPVVAAGGIVDGRGIKAALALGASAVQIGTAYLLCPESHISALHREALIRSSGADTAITNLFTGRPARGIVNRLMRELGPMADDVPAFPTAGGALGPLRAADAKAGTTDFTNLWSGQGRPLPKGVPAQELTRRWIAQASEQ